MRVGGKGGTGCGQGVGGQMGERTTIHIISYYFWLLHSGDIHFLRSTVLFLLYKNKKKTLKM